jgi:hypothetical protein
MTRRWFKTISLISGVFLGLTLGLTIAAFWLSPWKQHLTITDSFHIGLFRGLGGDLIGRITFFNDSEYGPYRGSIIGLVDEQGNLLYEGGRAQPIRRFFWSVGDHGILCRTYVDERGEPVQKESSCDLPGIYYRRFEWSETVLWTLMVSFWYPLFLFALLPCLWVGLQLMRRGHYAGPKSQPQQIAPADGTKARRK